MEGMGVAREGRKGRWKGLKGIEEMGGWEGRVKDAEMKRKEKQKEEKNRRERQKDA